MMVRFLVAALLIVLGAVGGYFYAQHDKLHSELEFALADGTPSRSEIYDYGCKGIVNATAGENVFPKNARALSGVSEDNASLHITPDKKGISVLFAYDVANGASEGQMLRIVSTSDPYIVAVGSGTLATYSLILNVKTLKAVFSFNGQGMLGVKGISTLFICH
jgi:hypothetical protein